MSPVLVTGSVIAVVFGVLLLLERLRPLRRTVEPKPRRVARNLTLGALSLAVGTLIQMPLLVPLARWVGEHRVGLLHLAPMPAAVEVILGVLLLDYTLWWWHWASHRSSFLWRFHLVHHVDRDMDASTALRFHFGEHLLSMVWRAAQIVAIGASPFAVWVWQLILFVSILFHHSNVELPTAWERRLVHLVVTPRMHGIHHSNRFENTDSNWSSLLSCWDVLHRTFRLDVPDEEIVIGVPAYREEEDVALPRLIAMPFMKQRRGWDQ